jgi:hypothetical protein
MSLLPLSYAGSVPQLHSPDLLVRLRLSQLDDILFELLYSSQEPEVLIDARHCTGGRAIDGGMTEWQGQHGLRVVSLGWDWAMLPDGSIKPLTAVGPRSNICLLDAKGYDMPAKALNGHLFDLIQRLAWQEHLARDMPWIGRPH